MLYYGPTLVHSIGMRGDTVTLLVSGGIGIVQFIAVLPAILWVDRVGRKPLLRGSSPVSHRLGSQLIIIHCGLGGSIVMAGAHLGIAILVMLFHSDWPSHPSAAWIAVGYVA